MTDFLLELRSEEIPARMQAGARESLSELFAAEMDARNQSISVDTVTYATPRRLTLISPGLPEQTPSLQVELKGPRVTAPTQALDGFLRKNGLTRDQLSEHDGVWFANIDRPGRPMFEVLAEVIPAVIRVFPWPKSMRWGAASTSTESLRWVRPLQGIVALFGDAVVPCEVAGVVSGAATVGHRFHHPGGITIGSAADYVEKLRACHVIVDQDERRQIVALGATMAANKAGLTLVRDEGLLIENAGLTEWPVPLLGRFDAAFLDVPPEVIQLTARVNQKYFVCRDAAGELANAFVCTANIDASDGGAKIVEGNRKVLAARLSDARFFYETDLKVPLAEQAKKLDRIVFHEKLGTVADKVERVAKLARWLVEEGIVPPSTLVGEGRGPLASASGKGEGSGAADSDLTPPHPSVAFGSSLPLPQGERERLAALAERAARLCKADLVTGMVGEFPELQGVMGGYYAAAQCEEPEVAAAIRDHYKPVGQGDEVPTAPVTVAVSLADKLDTLFSFFEVQMFPTGSKDPFALRRAALGILRLIQTDDLRFRIDYASRAWANDNDAGRGIVLADFLHDRLGVQLREAGVRYDLVQASTSWRTSTDDRLDRVEVRARALQGFVGTEDGANLLAGYKRAASILRKEGWQAPSPLVGEGRGPSRSDGTGEGVGGSERRLGPPHPSVAFGSSLPLPQGEREVEPAERALLAALDAAEPAAAEAVAREDFEGAMAALATLRAPIDAFFDQVTVNDPDPAKRERRLALLARVRDAVHNVADFSKIEG